MNDVWKLQDAKNRFSELVDRALKDGAQIVTRHGEKVVVVLSYDEYEKITKPEGNLVQFILSSPLAGSELLIERDSSLPRDVGIEP